MIYSQLDDAIVKRGRHPGPDGVEGQALHPSRLGLELGQHGGGRFMGMHGEMGRDEFRFCMHTKVAPSWRMPENRWRWDDDFVNTRPIAAPDGALEPSWRVGYLAS